MTNIQNLAQAVAAMAITHGAAAAKNGTAIDADLMLDAAGAALTQEAARLELAPLSLPAARQMIEAVFASSLDQILDLAALSIA